MNSKSWFEQINLLANQHAAEGGSDLAIIGIDGADHRGGDSRLIAKHREHGGALQTVAGTTQCTLEQSLAITGATVSDFRRQLRGGNAAGNR